MAERLTPGVYVEEVPGGVRPIQGVGTSTAAFVGRAQRGIPDRATFVNGFGDFQRQFGGHSRGEAGFLAQAVDAFFAAGGRRAFVVRVLPANAGPPAFSSALPARGRRCLGRAPRRPAADREGPGRLGGPPPGPHRGVDGVRRRGLPAAASSGSRPGARARWRRSTGCVWTPSPRTTWSGSSTRPPSTSTRTTSSRSTSSTPRSGPTPPIPGRAPSLDAVPGADGRLRRPRRARLTFAWDDLSSSTPTQASVDGRAQRGGDRGRGRDGRRSRRAR